ncbi:MAG: insulinase family protein [Chloroflexota bacterium]|nr:MAG: insulinase family protein [Chloroflexota bacterium]
MFERTVLTNGLRVVSMNLPHARSVSCALFLGIGSRHERDAACGISHFVEHMLFKGTTTRPTAKDISVAIEQLGGMLNAETGKEVTVYWDKVSGHHWRAAIELLADVIRNSLFDAREVDKERGVIIEELSMLVDSPVDWVHLLIDEVVWAGHPLGRDIAGNPTTIAVLTPRELRAHAATWYSSSNAVMAVAGPIEHAPIVDFVSKVLGDWQTGDRPESSPANGYASAGRIRLLTKDTEQTHMCLAMPGQSYADPDRYALDLANVVLGDGMSSRLFQEVRERRGLAYDVHSYVNRFRDTGSLVVYAGVDPPRAVETLRAIVSEVTRFASTIDDEEIARAKDFWKGRLDLRLEDTRSMASWIGSQELLLGHIQTAEDVIEQIDRVTREDVIRVATEVFRRENFSLAMIGPAADRATLDEVLGA